MPLYEVAVLERPTKKEAEEGAIERLIIAPKAVMARNEQAAVIAATRGPELDKVDYDRIEVKVRPF